MSENLLSAVNDKSRKVRLRGKQAIVPLKFDREGDIVTNETHPSLRIIKCLTLTDLAFLKVWKESGWDIEKTRAKTNYPEKQFERLVKRLGCFRDEDAKVQALAEIPTPAWITAKHVENVYAGGKDNKSQQKSLEELAKIEGAYKQTAPTTEINIWNLPQLPPDKAAKVKEMFDTLAEETHAA